MIIIEALQLSQACFIVFVEEYKSDPVLKPAVDFISKLVTATFSVGVVIIVISVGNAAIVAVVVSRLIVSTSTVSHFWGVTTR